MPPLREFCPHCGTPTSPGLRRHDPNAPGGRSPEELQHNRKTVLIVCAAIAAVLAIGKLSWPFGHVPHGVHIDIDEPAKGPVTTTADELIRAYASDSDAAEKMFGGREIEVTGEFLRIVPDGYGSIDMRLKSPNPQYPLGVDVVNASVDDAKKLKPGQQVTVSCRNMAGSGYDRWLQNCAIQPGGDAGAAPSPPAPPPAGPPPPPEPGAGNSG